MDRRSILAAVAAAAGGLFAAGSATRAKATTAPATPDKSKVVYHLSDFDRANFVLVNIGNHVEGVGGPEHVTIALVVHGPALRAFQSNAAHPGISVPVNQLVRAGYELAACGNTMRSLKIGLADLLPGFISADKGGVVRMAERQSQGYLYLRP